MDHYRVDDCFPTIEIRLLSEDDIHRPTEARGKTWKVLLAGERDRWNSIEELLKMYGEANNNMDCFRVRAHPLAVRLEGDVRAEFLSSK
jgi:hypothetical protein